MEDLRCCQGVHHIKHRPVVAKDEEIVETCSAQQGYELVESSPGGPVLDAPVYARVQEVGKKKKKKETPISERIVLAALTCDALVLDDPLYKNVPGVHVIVWDKAVYDDVMRISRWSEHEAASIVYLGKRKQD